MHKYKEKKKADLQQSENRSRKRGLLKIRIVAQQLLIFNLVLQHIQSESHLRRRKISGKIPVKQKFKRMLGNGAGFQF